MTQQKSVTINLTKANYHSELKFKRWEIFIIRQFPYSSGKKYNIITKDGSSETDTDSTTHSLSLYGLNISRWWVIRKIQLKVLKTVFKN